MEIKTRQYYKQAYNKRMEEITAEVRKSGSADYKYDASIEFDQTANTNEVVGYYLVNEGDNAYEVWCMNTAHLTELTQQDKDVTGILKHLNDLNMAPVKEVKRGDETMLVSTEEFEKECILDDEGEYRSEEAKRLDESIYCYIPYDDFHSSEQYVAAFIKEY